MYPIDFKNGTPKYSKDWEQAISLKEIDGPIVVVNGDKCVSDLILVDFEGEPESVDQVLVATWVNDKLTLKNVKGMYLEFINGKWTLGSKAVSKAGLLDVEEGWSFYNQGNILNIQGQTQFQVYIKHEEPETEVPTIEELEAKAGRALTEAEALDLYKALDRGELQDVLAGLREKSAKRI